MDGFVDRDGGREILAEDVGFNDGVQGRYWRWFLKAMPLFEYGERLAWIVGVFAEVEVQGSGSSVGWRMRGGLHDGEDRESFGEE